MEPVEEHIISSTGILGPHLLPFSEEKILLLLSLVVDEVEDLGAFVLQDTVSKVLTNGEVPPDLWSECLTSYICDVNDHVNVVMDRR